MSTPGTALSAEGVVPIVPQIRLMHPMPEWKAALDHYHEELDRLREDCGR